MKKVKSKKAKNVKNVKVSNRRRKQKPWESKPWALKDLTAHAVKVAKRKTIEAKIALIYTELRAAEEELRLAEVEISQHAGDVEFDMEDKHARHK